MSVWADIIFAGGIIVALAAGLDLLIGAGGRRSIADRIVGIWAWLDRAKQEPMLQWVEKHHVMGVMTTIGALFLVSALIVIDQTTGILTHEQVGFIAGIAGFACLLGLYTISSVIHNKTLLQSFRRISLFTSIAMIPFVVSLAPMEFIQPGYTDLQVAVQEAWLVFLISSLLLAGLYALFWLAIAGPLATIYVARAILKSAKIMAAKRSRNRSQSILAAGIGVACIAGVFRALAARTLG